MSRRARGRVAALLAVVALLVGVLTGCSEGLGALGDVGRHVQPQAVRADERRVAAVFDDALNLTVGAPVKAEGVVVGRVTGIEPDDYRARVEMAIREHVELPADSRFRLRYTTALGELYVDARPGRSAETLADGAVVGGPSTSTAATVEDTLASASLLVNGGGLAQLRTVVDELNTALHGRVGATRSLLGETDRFLDEVLRSARQIDRVLHGLRRAARVLDRRETTVDRALRDLRPAARVLADNTDDLVRLLRRTDRLAVTSDRLVTRTRDDLLTVVDELGPVLEEVLAEQETIVAGLDTVDHFADRLDAAAPTDYLNLYFLLHLDDLRSADPDGGTSPGELPGLPDLPQLPGLPQLSGLPQLPGLPVPGTGHPNGSERVDLLDRLGLGGPLSRGAAPGRPGHGADR